MLEYFVEILTFTYDLELYTEAPPRFPSKPNPVTPRRHHGPMATASHIRNRPCTIVNAPQTLMFVSPSFTSLREDCLINHRSPLYESVIQDDIDLLARLLSDEENQSTPLGDQERPQQKISQPSRLVLPGFTSLREYCLSNHRSPLSEYTTQDDAELSDRGLDDENDEYTSLGDEEPFEYHNSQS